MEGIPINKSNIKNFNKAIELCFKVKHNKHTLGKDYTNNAKRKTYLYCLILYL